MNFFKKIFGTHHNEIPSRVTDSLPVHFINASGIEWNIQNSFYEAIFFHDKVEKIARFDSRGNLLEYRVNISPDSIPSPIHEGVAEGLEIMNCIALYTSEKLSYELIVRDRDLVRYKLILDSLGNRVEFVRL
ncbi:MAG: hypothetical protein IH591_01320 [Bacteroidales bacterium]|nr:hypothetical protein [Bacteroidales bacterium]